MAEAAQGGGDPVLMIRGVLNMTQPYQELENLGRTASEGTTFSNSGTPGTSGSTATRERASRAMERQGDLGDAEQASFNVSARQARNRQVQSAIGIWGDIGGPTGGGVVRARSGGETAVRSTGPVRHAYRQNQYSEDWESAISDFAAADPWSAQARDEGMAKRARIFGHAARMGQDDWTRQQANEAFENQFFGPPSFETSSGDYGSDPLNVRQPGGSRRRSRAMTRQAQLRQERLPMFGPGDGPDANFNRARAEALAEENAPTGDLFGPGFGPTAQGNRNIAEERAANATWTRRNLPTLFGPRHGGGMSMFYRRFLAMEALRGISQAALTVSQAPGMLAGAGSDQMALGQAQYNITRQFAESVPFAGGLIFGAADIISGTGGELSRAGASISAANSLMASRQQSGDARYGLLQQSRVMAAPRGFARESQRITEQEDTANREVRAREKTEGDRASDQANASRADLSSRVFQNNVRNLINTVVGAPLLSVSSIDENAEGQAISIQSLRSANLAGARRKADEEKNAAIAATHQRELAEDMMLTRVGGVVSGGVALSQAQRAIVLQGTALADPRAQAAVAIQGVQNANETQTAMENMQMFAAYKTGGQAGLDAIAPGINLQRQARDVQARNQTLQIQAQADRQTTQMNIGLSGVNAQLRARLAHDPAAEAQARYNQGQAEASLLPVDMQARARENVEFQRRVEGEEIQRTAIGYRMQAGNLQARLNRDPYQGINSTFQGQMDLAKISPFGKQQEEHAQLQQQVAMQEIRDRQVALGGHQALSLGVSAMLATAVGPGASDKRRQASIMQIAGSAELTAESLMRDESLGNQHERTNFANNARQEGINNIGAQRAQYLQGFRSTSRSRFEIAPGNQESTNPSSVLRAFEGGIQSLKKGMNSTDFTGEKGSTNDSVPALLRQLIQVMQGGAVMRTSA